MTGASLFASSGPGRVQETVRRPLENLRWASKSPEPDGAAVNDTPEGKASVTVMVRPAEIANGPKLLTAKE